MQYLHPNPSFSVVTGHFADPRDYGRHNATDYAFPYGTPVYASADAFVQYRNWAGNCGRLVELSHDDGSVTGYCHLAEMLVDLAQPVYAGQLIAMSGASGYGSDHWYDPHLHIRITAPSGAPLDPETLLNLNWAPPRPAPSPPPPPKGATEMFLIREINPPNRVWVVGPTGKRLLANGQSEIDAYIRGGVELHDTQDSDIAAIPDA